MDRYAQCFEQLAAQRQGALVPFVVLGDPNQDDSLAIIQTLIDAGADALELGLPFSDPLADGPTIQGAMNRALQSGITPDHCFAMLDKIRGVNSEIPIGLLVYANLVYARGLEGFYERCAKVGVDSVLIADVPVGEVHPFLDASKACSIKTVLLCPPNINDETLQAVAAQGQGYTYLLSRPGVTGTSVAAGRPVSELLAKLHQHNAPPPLLGFGISRAEQVRQAIDCGARGVICGSAIIERIEKNLPTMENVKKVLSQYVGEMKAATRR